MKHDEKKCPACAECIKKAAVVCRHCGHKFDPAEVARQQATDQRTNIAAAIVLLLIIAFGISMCSGEGDPKEVAAAAAKAAEDKRKGFHCLSAFDGSSSQFIAAVKAQLRDPDSFEHEETRIMPVDKDGQHLVYMKYRAKNGFGGVNRTTAFGAVAQSDCAATVASIDVVS